MYCRHCGKEILEDSNFCEYCGNQVRKEEKKKTEYQNNEICCKSCGTVLVEQNRHCRFCPTCGEKWTDFGQESQGGSETRTNRDDTMSNNNAQNNKKKDYDVDSLLNVEKRVVVDEEFSHSAYVTYGDRMAKYMIVAVILNVIQFILWFQKMITVSTFFGNTEVYSMYDACTEGYDYVTVISAVLSIACIVHLFMCVLNENLSVYRKLVLEKITAIWYVITFFMIYSDGKRQADGMMGITGYELNSVGVFYMILGVGLIALLFYITYKVTNIIQEND